MEGLRWRIMKYLICDDKLVQVKYKERIDAVKEKGIKIYEYLNTLKNEFGNQLLMEENDSWTLLIHYSNADFNKWIFQVLEEFQKKTSHIELILISTEPFQLDEDRKQEFLKYVNEVHVMGRFTPEIYLNVKSWGETLKNDIFKRDLFPDKPAKYLPALSILCQGYLAVYAEKRHPDPGENEWKKEPAGAKIAAALRQMGWFKPEMRIKRELIKAEVDRKFLEICKAGWWDIFEEEIENNNLVAEIDIECKGDLPMEIRSLVEGICKGNVTAESVAVGYCSIAREMGGVLCGEDNE
jgi:hypothetical protein